MNRRKTHYHLLGVEPTVSLTEIKRAYRKLVKNYHPDLGHADQKKATEYMMQLNEAYETLIDGSRRAAYDSAIGIKQTRFNFSRSFDSFDEDRAKEHYLREIFHPCRSTIGRLLSNYQSQLRKLSLDIYDEELLAEFEKYVDQVESALLKGSNDLSSQVCPKSLNAAVQMMRYAIAQAADGLEEMQCFCQNFDYDHLAMTSSLFKIAQELSKDALYLIKG